ncbi:MAG: hypothetical protein KDN22_18430, partial [Verrucomicrobiae bacterium]|nr:hypothetical protein [Verrucomicrobiae bacterium]
QGEVQKEIDDYSAVVALEGAPAEQVAKALFNRGVAHGQLDEVQKEIDDYSAVVALEGALAEQVVRALCNRGATHSHQGDVQKAIDDFSAVVALEGVPAEHVAAALYGLGLTFFQMRKMDLAAQSFEQLVGLAGAPSIRKSDAYLTIAEIQCGQGQWEEGFASMAQGVELGASVSPPHIGDIESILALIFDAGLSRGELEKKVSIFSAILGQHSAYGALGESLVHHLGSLTKSDDPPASDQLNRWLAIWEKIADGVPDLIIPMRLFRTGIRYLLSEDRDESVLLDLRFDERELLRQALGLDDGDAKP